MLNYTILKLTVQHEKKQSISLKMTNESHEQVISLYSKGIDYTVESYPFKNNKIVYGSLSLKSKNCFASQGSLNIKTNNSVSLTQAIEQGIYNKVMICDFKSYNTFNGATMSFMSCYSRNKNRNNAFFPMTNKTCNEILKYHQDKITSIEQYRRMKATDVINNKIYDEIKYFI